ncbi:MAG TPA: hypothetical protein VKU41_09815 [Polyangiaceae bacterium]|nr:hypothetical protein [Polyangiaceae bacterium]
MNLQRRTWTRAATVVMSVGAPLFGCGPSGAERTGASSSAASPAGPIPASWTIAAWYVDPSNTTGTASDTNTCTSASQPCLSYGGVAQQWGTYSPRLRQNTTLTFLSSHTSNVDPVYLTPLLENGATVTVQATLGSGQQVATGTLSGVVRKNRSSAQLLVATLPSGAAPGLLVANSTRSSRAWVYANAGGNNWSLSQPITSPVAKMTAPAENDVWANGDAVILYRPIAIDLVEASPTVTDSGGSMAQFEMSFQHVTVLDPTGAGVDNLIVGSDGAVNFVESSIQRNVTLGAGPATVPPSFVNVDLAGSLQMGLPPADALGTPIAIDAGQVRAPAGSLLVRGTRLDSDVIVGVPCLMAAGGFGNVFLDRGVTMTALEGSVGSTGPAWDDGDGDDDDGVEVLWGPGAVDVAGNARLEYPKGGVNPAQTVFQHKGGLTINGQASACTRDPSLLGGSWKCGIALTPANLDKAISLGGFGGIASNPGGGAIANAAADY